MMQKRAESELIDAVGIYFHHATPGLGPALQAYKSPEWEGRREWGERSRDKAVAGMRYFDKVLATQPYVSGEFFSMADITVWAGLLFAGFADIPVPEDCTSLLNWRQKVDERSSVKNPA
jgi:glutathione S-transferase